MSSFFMRCLGIGAKHHSKRSGSLIVPSAAPGSTGDDAMLTSLVTALHDAGEGPVEILAKGGAAAWPSVAPAGLYELTGGKSRAIKLALKLRKIKRIYVIGADCVDGHYSLQLSLSLIGAADAGAHAGAIATIAGCSYSESPEQATADAIRNMHPDVHLYGRDPRTVERFKRLAGRDSELVTDLAFMLQPAEPKTPNAPEDLAWIKARRDAGRVLLGVNFNRQVLGKNPSVEETQVLFDKYVGALRQILEKNDDVDIVLIPHDYRGEESDCAHAGRLAELLSNPDRVRALTERYRANEIKYYGSLMDVILTGRMHLAIESMGAGVPVACVTYQGKFEGLFDQFRMEPIVVAPEDASADALYEMVSKTIGDRQALKDHIADQLDRIRAASRKNLSLEG